jgi:hypothetical protein
MLTGKAGSMNVKNTVQRGNSFPSLFPVSLYALDMDHLAKADWMFSLLIPCRESMLKDLRDMSLNWI